MRTLSPDEAELWARVTATIAPLSRDKLPAKLAEEPKPQVSESVPPKTQASPPAKRLAPLRPRPGTTLDGSWDKRLRSGRVEPDRVLDLHGMTLDEAWQAIDTSLDRAVARGDRVLLLITGHHRPGEPPVQRGKIRASVHDWLAASRYARRIAAVRGAHLRHGGGGSLYIILRRDSRVPR